MSERERALQALAAAMYRVQTLPGRVAWRWLPRAAQRQWLEAAAAWVREQRLGA